MKKVGLVFIALLLATGCNRVSGVYRQVNDPNSFLVLNRDGTCRRDNYACTYTVSGNKVTITMQMMGMIFDGVLDGDRLTLSEPNIVGGKNQTVFVRQSAGDPSSGATRNNVTSSADPVGAFLQQNQAYHLMGPGDSAWADDAEFRAAFKAEIRGDARGGKGEDLVAVLVHGGAHSKRFSVAVFPGTARGQYSVTPIWVVQNWKAMTVVGIMRPGFVSVAACYHCDGAVIYGWTGSEFEEGLLSKDDKAEVVSDRPVGLLSKPSREASVVAKLSRCTKLKVLSAVPRRAGWPRYYEVQTTGPSPASGYVESRGISYESPDCE
jgi:hypothetical protein